MNDKADWIYARVLRKGNLILPRPLYWLGWVEFTPPSALDPPFAEAIAHSLASYGAAALEKSDPHHVIARTIVLDATQAEAMSEGQARLVEAIEALRTKIYPLPQDFTLSPAGALLDLRRDAPSALRAPWRHPFGTGMILDDRAIHPQYTLNLLLTAPNAFGTLGLAYLRSLHWKQLAGKATTVAEKILLYWMTTEALCSTTVGDNPIPRLMRVSGFPIGRHARDAAALRQGVRNHRLWSKRIHSLLETTRRTRNSIVHEGHRDVDIRQRVASPDERDVLRFLATAIRCLHTHAELALSAGSAPLSRLWEPGRISETCMRENAEWIVAHLEGVHGAYEE